MNTIKIFLLEDNEQDYQSFADAAKILHQQGLVDFQIDRFKNCADSLAKLDNSFDGAIIDLRLGTELGAGNEIAKRILENYKIPTVIYTGTPADSSTDHNKIPVFKKGSSTCNEVLIYFREIYETGLTKIFGDRGYINQAMKNYFWEHLMPDIASWKSHSIESSHKEKSLLKVVLNHLTHALGNESEMVLGEEMYIYGTATITMGSLVNYREKIWIIMTPSCDLVPRIDKKTGKSQPKTGKVLLCEVVPSEPFFSNLLKDKNSEGSRNEAIDKILKNQNPFLHWLPETSKFVGGVIHFRNLLAVDVDEIFNVSPTCKVDESFAKDIVARFGSYYSRQGQPDFSFDYLAKKISGKYGPSA